MRRRDWFNAAVTYPLAFVAIGIAVPPHVLLDVLFVASRSILFGIAGGTLVAAGLWLRRGLDTGAAAMVWLVASTATVAVVWVGSVVFIAVACWGVSDCL
jgi:hypothetical protein